MGIPHDGEFAALNRTFRQPVHHREDTVMMTRRNWFEKPTPAASGGRQDEGVLGSAATCASMKLKVGVWFSK
jgi:hypothetical protein